LEVQECSAWVKAKIKWTKTEGLEGKQCFAWAKAERKWTKTERLEAKKCCFWTGFTITIEIVKKSTFTIC